MEYTTSAAPVASQPAVIDALQKEGAFSIAPCSQSLDLEDETRFKRLTLSPEQSSHMSALLQQVPGLAAAGTLANAYVVKFPEGLPHTLTALKQGGYSTMIKEADGKFAGTASLYSMEMQAALLGAFTAMSIASSQYFLTQINQKLQVMQLKLDEILEFLYGDKKAELLAEMSFIRYAYQNFNSIMAHDAQRVATIVSLQKAKTVAMQDVEFYIADLEATAGRRAKDFAEIENHVAKALQTQESLAVSQQLYAISGIMEAYYAQNQDKEYLQILENEMVAYMDKCDKRTLSSLSKLEGQINAYKPKPMEKIDKAVAEEQIHKITDKLNGEAESAQRKAVRDALHMAERPAEYYFSGQGGIYVKSA